MAPATDERGMKCQQLHHPWLRCGLMSVPGCGAITAFAAPVSGNEMRKRLLHDGGVDLLDMVSLVEWSATVRAAGGPRQTVF